MTGPRSAVAPDAPACRCACLPLLACLSFLVPAPADAAEVMAGAEAVLVHARVAGESFDPVAARARLAVAMTPEWEAGVLGGAGVADDTAVGVNATVNGLWAGYVRYSASLDDDARLALILGYGEMTLDVTSRLPGFPGSQSYSGVLYGLSLQERLSRYPHWIGSLDFERWYDDKGLKIGTISYGFRYEF